MTLWRIGLLLALAACSKSSSDRAAREAAHEKETVDKLAANRRALDEVRGSLRALVTALPTGDALKTEVPCGLEYAPGTKATTVDDDVLQAIIVEPLPAAPVEAQLARMTELSTWRELTAQVWRDLLADTLADGEARTRPEQTVWNGKQHTLWRVAKLPSWLATQFVIVFRGTKVEPVMKGSTFEPGSFEGTMFVIDVARRKSCHTPLSAKSEMFAKVGGDSGGLTPSLVRGILRVARTRLATIAPGLEIPRTKGE